MEVIVKYSRIARATSKEMERKEMARAHGQSHDILCPLLQILYCKIANCSRV
jgi:hypothetical protein